MDLRVGERPVVLSVGRLSEEKNLSVIIDAVECLQDRRPAGRIEPGRVGRKVAKDGSIERYVKAKTTKKTAKK